MTRHVSMMGLSLCGDNVGMNRIPAHNPTIVTTQHPVLYCTVLYCTAHNPAIVTTRCSSDPLPDWPPSLQLTNPAMFLPTDVPSISYPISILAKTVC